ncbi:hypothetical protein [Hydrogenophaga sp.]|uniref:hypothetical protein n=1 Tax=Hydrogenophaga sp. TaxID=1904254 RepID=UPI002731F224|nr:hypothetical protein [Hydrogenophaga sp.]MDP1688309.1 hypothetical protein [Hydrogenophaga sp.]
MAIPTSEQFDEYLRRMRNASRREAWLLLQLATHNPPRFFYKYLHQNSKSVRSQIVDSKLWLASPDTLNDPFEMALHVVFEGTPGEKRKALKGMAKSTGASWKQRNRIAETAYKLSITSEMNLVHRQRASKGLPPIKIFQSRLATARYRLYVERARKIEAR